MILARDRRRLTTTEALTFLKAADEDLLADESDLQAVIPGLPCGYFQTGLKEGWCNVTTVICGGQPAYRLYWQMRCLRKHFHVMASLFVGQAGAENPDAWAQGAESIARAMGAEKITFETMRKGHIIQALSWGAVVTGVMMEKKL